MLYLKVDNGYSMETIFKTKDDFKKMEEMRAKAEKLFPDSEVIVTTN
tara:strand:- start:155 stop:295 length:141 start_codon:yes stop_codon:yes gene_type:complete